MSEWKQISDGSGNEDGGIIWKPENSGDFQIGRYIEKEENTGTDGDSTLYHFENEDGIWKVWETAVLKGLFGKVDIGRTIKLVYKGTKKSRGGKWYKVFELFVKDEDAGGEPSSSSSSNEPEIMDLSGKQSDEQAVNDIINQQTTSDWFEKLQPYLPEKHEDLEIPEKRHAEWINRIRNDIIGTGTKPEKVTIKAIRDNVAILVEDGATSDHDLGKLDIEAGKGIFTLLHKVEK